jgi:putative heme degradation protein
MTAVDEELLFSTEKGDICLRLIESWPQMLTDTAILGSLLLLSRTEQVVVASRVARTDFWPVPQVSDKSWRFDGIADSTDMMELGSGFAVDMADLHFAVAADECLEKERMLALQFFDKYGAGMFKAILTEEADYEWFARYIQHYARGGCPPHISAASRPPLPASGPLAADPEGIAWLREMWPQLDSSVPGDYIPGWEDMTRYEALEQVGEPFARPSRYEDLLQGLLMASQFQFPLSFTLFNQGLHHHITMVPRRMERCGDSVHLMDRHTEAHILRAPGLTMWQTVYRKEEGITLELFGSDRRRCCQIKCVGEPREIHRWSEIFLQED